VDSRRAGIAVLGALAGCSPAPTSVFVTLTSSDAAVPAHVLLSAYNPYRALVLDHPLTAPSLPSSVIVALPSQSQNVRLALDSSDSPSLGGAVVAVRPHAQARAQIEFDATVPDVDGDGVPDSIDNCPRTANHDQADADGDGVGDACEQGDGGSGDGGTLPIMLVGARWLAPQTQSAVTLAAPSGVAAADVLLLCIYTGTAQVNLIAPSGYTALTNITDANAGFRVWWFTRVVGADNPDAQFGLDRSTTVAAALLAYRSVRTSAPVDVSSMPMRQDGVVSGNRITFTAPSVTTTVDNDRLVGFFIFDSGDSDSWTQMPAGASKLIDTGTLAVFEKALGTAGATGAASGVATYMTSDAPAGATLVVALAP
jgi:hypothetical protein